MGAIDKLIATCRDVYGEGYGGADFGVDVIVEDADAELVQMRSQIADLLRANNEVAMLNADMQEILSEARERAAFHALGRSPVYPDAQLLAKIDALSQEHK